MRFYDALQLDPAGLKEKIRSAETPKERHHFQLAILTRAILIVAFSTILIAPVSPLFGAENSCMAVTLLCILLSIRFVDFGYNIRDSLRNLAIVFFLLFASPAVAALLPPLLAALVHFVTFFIILTMTSEQPQMGNGGLYAFGYIFLAGNPVTGELLWKRFLLTLVGYLLCAGVFFMKHSKKNQEVPFRSLLANFRLTDPKCQWQLQMALGITLLLTLGKLLHVERLMWAGFACASLLGCYSSGDSESLVKERFWQRMLGALLGSGLFALLYAVTPEAFHGLFGTIGGICVGFCTEYRYKTALNCFGALMLSTGLYGLGGSVLLRIADNFLGAAFGYGFCVLYQWFINRHFTAAEKREINS